MRRPWIMILLTVLTMAALPAVAGASVWSIEPSPNVAGSSGSWLTAVSCSGASCMAIGGYVSAIGQGDLAESFDGTEWTIVPMPSPAKDNILQSISCAGPNVCEAVGGTIGAGGAQRALAEGWNGETWVLQPTPLVGGADATVGLDGVSCTSPDSCEAVGGLTLPGVSAEEQPLVERWDGSTWTVQFVPNPKAENGSELNAVSCTAVDACTAGGTYYYADVASSVFAMRWNGTSWRMQAQPNLQGQSVNATDSVSCSGPATCTSVGSWTNDWQETLAENWGGVFWRIQLTPNPPTSVGSELISVSCVASGTCESVGNWSPSQTTGSALAEGYDGRWWTRQWTPTPSGATFSDLSGVDCLAAESCVAVGSCSTSSSADTLVENLSP